MPGAWVASGERVTLRTLEQEDLPDLQRVYTNPDIRYPLGASLKNLKQLEDEFDEGFGDAFVICLDGDEAGPGSPDKDDVRRIGFILVKESEPYRPELAFALVPEVHGEGYAKDAVSLAVEYVFRTHEHPGVYAWTFPSNEASRGLLKSLGFTEEGRARKDYFNDGEYRDRIHYSLLRREWRNQN